MSEKILKLRPKLIFAGTRPEIIKLAPVYKELLARGHQTLFCATRQHSDLSGQALKFFGIKPEIELSVASPGQSLASLSEKLLHQTGQAIDQTKPSAIIVQGDTMTVTCAAMAAFLRKVPVFHVEAGLRSGDLSAPFPEEANRRICSSMTELHFAPTQKSATNLIGEGINEQKIFIVGNTVVDSLKLASEKIKAPGVVNPEIKGLFQNLKTNFKKTAILTMHRRESFNGGLENLAQAISEQLKTGGPDELALIYPKHPNPNLEEFCKQLCQSFPDQIMVSAPLNYPDFVYLLNESNFVITDSGGVLEEASVLCKPIVCVREKIERPEALQNPKAFLTGFDQTLIGQAIKSCLKMDTPSTKEFSNIFGDGQASKKIVKIIELHEQANSNIKVNPARHFHNSGFLPQKKLTVSIFGLGYIGLPTATVLAKSGFSVTGVDTDNQRLEQIQSGKTDFLEGTLKDDLKQALDKNLIKLTKKITEPSDFYLICVPTPIIGKDADLSYVFACVDEVGKALKPGSLVVLESTVPVGTTEKFSEKLSKLSGLKANKDFFVAYCPERIIPGRIETELVENDRVIGVEHSQAFLMAQNLYKSFCKGQLSQTDTKTAELVKLLENSTRNVEVAFANEVYDIAEQFEVSPSKLRELANKHPRINILNPGPGVGGHCVAVDPFFLERGLREHCPILSTSILENKNRPAKLVKKIISIAEKSPKQLKVLVMGLAYKPNVSDLRESPALEISQALASNKKISLKVFEPHISTQDFQKLELESCGKNIMQAIENADLIAVLVAHESFKEIISKTKLDGKIIVDPTSLVEKVVKVKPILKQFILKKILNNEENISN